MLLGHQSELTPQHHRTISLPVNAVYAACQSSTGGKLSCDISAHHSHDNLFGPDITTSRVLAATLR